MHATGWLGWSPEAALDAPLSQITLALTGKFDFLRKTNPWRTKEDVEEDRIRDMKPDPESGVRAFSALKAIAKRLPKRKPKGATNAG